MYELDDKKDIKGLSKFVKDIICFSNTIRNETSHIIVGIAELDDGSKELKGLDKSYDDAFFQDKIKDKVYPRPNFLYYQVEHQGNRFGVFEFPVTRYSTPISSVVALKGLEIGRVYYRHGTTNSEAIGQDVIRISDWLRSIPEEPTRHESLNDKLSNILGRLSDGTEKLSVIFPELLNISRTHELTELKDFCVIEITGFKGKKSEAERNEYKYRIQPVLIAPFRIELNPYSFVKATPHSLKNEMKQNENFFDYRMFFTESISSIEQTLFSYRNNPDSVCATIEMNSKQAFPGGQGKEHQVFVYIFPDTYEGLYRSIRQTAIDKIMQI